MFLVSSHA